ncbi:peptide deformylase [Nocardia alni]|uniref:peptide deformylase n=1 Tax=Nocardia alni TaxID=2815723 RepID=UPI001C245E7E
MRPTPCRHPARPLRDAETPARTCETSAPHQAHRSRRHPGDRPLSRADRKVQTSAATDEQYEWFLSLFELRGRVPRPLTIHVEHTDIDGRTHIIEFEHGDARLVAHEIDHLHGHLHRPHEARRRTDPC